MPIYNRLGKILKETDTSQNRLARQVGTRPGTINDLVHNRTSRGDWELWERILANFGITSLDDMFYIADKPEEDN